MKVYSMIGSLIVTLALLFYSIGFVKEQRKKLVTSSVLLFFSLGVILDISATILMILGSSNGMFTLHGLLGYSALLGMCIDAVLLWQHKFKNGSEAPVSKKLNTYSKIVYFWWVIAFITGGLMVALKHRA